jgi:hypothetical protein
MKWEVGKLYLIKSCNPSNNLWSKGLIIKVLKLLNLNDDYNDDLQVKFVNRLHLIEGENWGSHSTKYVQAIEITDIHKVFYVLQDR